MPGPLRKADGTPELRNMDDLLREAGKEGAFSNLPGHGKPIDLSSYFAGGNDTRIAHKLLADNAVLPRSLQFLKDAEAAVQNGESLLNTRGPRLTELLSDLRLAFARASAIHTPEAVLAHTGWRSWPAALNPGDSLPDCDCEHTEAADDDPSHIADGMDRYRRLRDHLLAEYTGFLKSAADSLRSHLMERAAAGHLSPQPSSPSQRAQLEEAGDRFAERFPDVPGLPADFVDRFVASRDKRRSPIRRILRDLIGV